jgi:ring-1,2-phenylacetyl-CoA epoxidase subunit PaaC
MKKEDALYRYVLRLADSALILGQRLIENVARGPELEEELANANFSLDYLGQARMLYTYAGEIEGKGRNEDDFALLRAEREFENLLLVELADGHFGDTIVRAVLFETFYLQQLQALANCSDERLAEIAARAEKEVSYHIRYARQWLVRLGDGTSESQQRVQESLDSLWKYTGELFAGDDVDAMILNAWHGPNLAKLECAWREEIAAVVAEAKLQLPEDGWMASGGREGKHTEQFGFLVAEMQYLQRAYPGLNW